MASCADSACNSFDRAARVGDHISHSYAPAGEMLGAALGIVIGCVITVASDGALIGFAPDVILIGADVGKAIGSHFHDEDSGRISRGAATVTTGEGMPRAARMSDALICADAKGTGQALMGLASVFGPPGMAVAGIYELAGGGSHPGAFVADGSECVFIEGWNAARRGDKTSCGGQISTGCETVLIGCRTIGRVGTKNLSEIPPWLDWAHSAVDWAGFILGFFDFNPESGFKLIEGESKWIKAAIATAFKAGETVAGMTDSKQTEEALSKTEALLDPIIADDPREAITALILAPFKVWQADDDAHEEDRHVYGDDD